MSFVQDFRNSFRSKEKGLNRIILVNVIIFVVVNIVDELCKLSGTEFSLASWLALPGDAGQALRHGWTLLTYMFLHEGFMHILFNMLWLYWIGRIFVEYVGSKRLVGVYLLGGLSGAILYMVSTLLFPNSLYHPMEGASAGVMAVVIAIAVLLPDYKIYLPLLGGIPLKYIALFSFIFTSIIDLSTNTGGKISHMGGALFGVLFMLQYKSGRDLTKPVTAFLDWTMSPLSGRSKIKVSYRRTAGDDDYNASQKVKQERVDAILDKISKAGYESLTKEEKDFLFKASGKG